MKRYGTQRFEGNRLNLKQNFIITGMLFLLFIGFTIAVKTVDVRAVGPENSSIGFAGINQFVLGLFGMNLFWYDITGWLGLAVILVAAGFAALGLGQLIKRKSLLKVDAYILLLGIFYILIVAVYIFFELVVINYRPVIMNTSLEASYPSSHTMIVVCILVTAMMRFKNVFKNMKGILSIVNIISVFIIGVTVAGRLVSGVHWFTDIVGGLLVAAALIMLYYSFACLIE